MKSKITKQDIVEKINGADNILIFTGGSPRIDQLSACIGLLGLLQDLDKNAVIVHEGEVTSVLDFLETDKLIQEDAESLRDFIISFSQSKVDKFRYNQEGDNYNILLTPSLRELITEEDIHYRKGDFNIDLIIALGVETRSSINPAISRHSQLVDEIPMVNIMAGKKDSSLEVACWQDDTASALGEMLYDLSQMLEIKKMRNQTLNALLTGIIDQTERYKNRQTKSQTMHVSAELLEMGADLQLIVDSLSQAGSIPIEIPEAETKEMVEEALSEAGEYDTQLVKNKKKQKSGKDRRLHMRHGDVDKSGLTYGEKVKQMQTEEEHKLDQLNIDAEGNLRILAEETDEQKANNNALANAPSPAQGPAMASASSPANQQPNQSAPEPSSAPSIERSTPVTQRNSLTPSSQIQAPHPAMNVGSNASATSSLADFNAVPPQMAAPGAANSGVSGYGSVPPAPVSPAAPPAPSISEIVDRSAEANRPAVPGLNEKVNALSPVNSNPNNYIDSLMSPAAGNPQQAPSQPPNPNQNQALTVDNYLAQQQSGGNPMAPNNSPQAPPAAPPLASMT